MTKQLKIIFCSLLTGAALWVIPSARADEWDKRTVLTFSEPVEIPGKVLAAGTYVFKLLDSQADRTIVQIFTQNEQQLLATIMAIPDYRTDTPEKTIVTFEERPAGTPEALHSWFYPGDNYGVEFVYSKPIEQVARTYEKPALVTAAPAPAPPTPVEVAAAPAPPAPPPPSTETLVVKEEEVVVLAQTDSAPDVSDQGTPSELPKTAENVLSVPLAGLMLLTAGFAVIRFARQHA